MKEFDRFIEEAAAKRCPAGQYYCFTDKSVRKFLWDIMLVAEEI